MLCKSCNLNYISLYNDLCVFCNIINNNNKFDTMNTMIGFTNISQNEIIKKTYEYFQEHDIIPKPLDIIQDVKILKVNPYIFREFVNNSKLFFTNCIDLNKIKQKRFPLKYNIQKLDINYLQNQIELKDYDINVFNLYKKFKDEYYLKYE
jgi:hypothetical protein